MNADILKKKCLQWVIAGVGCLSAVVTFLLSRSCFEEKVHIFNETDFKG